ncbi:MAG TPA: hypothetical protein VGG99_12235 [Acetobacteraceae bacterium]
MILHESTQADMKARNRKGGHNERAMSRVLLTTIYQFWEDRYRGLFASEIGSKKDEVTSDFFGDIRYIRNAIVHHRNVATVEVNKCKVLKLFTPGDAIHLTADQVRFVVRGVRLALDEICQRYLGVDGGFASRHGLAGHQRA